MIRLSRSNDIETNSERNLDNAEEDTDFKLSIKKGKMKLIKNCFIEYTKNSNLHGIKYIGEKNITTVEKIFWIFVFTCSAFICMGLIHKVWLKWNESTVNVSFTEHYTPVWQIPYPAVTVCSETKAMQSQFNFTNYYHSFYDSSSDLTEEELELYEHISMMCDDHFAPVNGKKFAARNTTIQNIKMVSPQMEDLFRGCKWKDMPTEDCSDLFSPIITEEGRCYTFNTLAANELFRLENLHSDYDYLEHQNSAQWTLEDGYPPSSTFTTYPHRGSGYGAKTGLVMLLRTNTAEMDYLCRGPVQGFKILLHNPAEFPRLSQQYLRLSLSQELVVVVKPKMTTTSEELRVYDPVRRQCYFPNERYLQYFKVYTETNCEVECLSNYTYARCGCVHFGLPHAPEINVCGAGRMTCIKMAQMELVTLKFEIETKIENDMLRELRSVATNCHCLPACTSIEYETETSQADFNWKALYSAYKIPIGNDTNDDYSRTMIFFKGAHFDTRQRFEPYTVTDFLTNCGGLLAFFMGFSIISVIEIIYFFTLRLCCLLRRRHRSNSSESDVSYSKVI